MKQNERKVYDYILQKSQSGVSPSVREICADLDIRSTSTASRYINSLVEKGFLEKDERHNRSIRPAGSSFVSVPVLGNVTSEQSVTELEDVIGHISVTPSDSCCGSQLFALKTKDDSMADAAILKGDTVVCEQCTAVKNGDMAAVMINGREPVIRKVYKEKSRFRLSTGSSSEESASDCTVLGRVVTVVRYI